MLENFTWNFFEKTGNIETYIEYINIRNCAGKTDGEKDEKQHDDREGSYN